MEAVAQILLFKEMGNLQLTTSPCIYMLSPASVVNIIKMLFLSNREETQAKLRVG